MADQIMEAELGWGDLFEIHDGEDPGEYEEYGRIDEYTLPSEETEEVDTTHMRSPNKRREFMAGLITPGEMTISMFWQPGTTEDEAIHLLLDSGEVRSMRITFLNGATRTFDGFVKKLEGTSPKDSKRMLNVTIKQSGAVARGAAT
jgi:hypothetical protein